ncbi:MAG: glycosyltransferase involved in cell wall biosynthesis [Hyphomicrobiaceae bacterium]|jgi:glycosyltransferase involved in cell wall biosynthesis
MTSTTTSPASMLRYLLVIHIPVYCNGDGNRYIDPLWRRDLVKHPDYISDFTIACPRIDGPIPEGLVPVDDPRIKFLDLPSRHKRTLALPAMAGRLWRGIGRADVVHSSLDGWMLASLENITNIIAKIRRKFLYINVESSPWRIDRRTRASWLERIRSTLSEVVNRWCTNMTDLSTFTQTEYKQSLLTRRPERGHVIHASWIDEGDIASDASAKDAWAQKLAEPTGPLKLLFAGRLCRAKGVTELLEALDFAEAKGLSVHLDVLGEGELLAKCQEAAGRPRHTTRLNLLRTVAYGPQFFAKLHQYHAVVVPSLSDEQPRIVYDAFSQGVPVLASRTRGLQDCVHSSAGWLFSPGDARALCNIWLKASEQRDALQELGLAGLGIARQMTHHHMHLRRRQLLDKYLLARGVLR